MMALSKKFGSLLQIAVRCCTLYGDMSGGLAVISDGPTTMVYRLVPWCNRGAERIPDRVLSKAPSAELRSNQTDLDTLPAYDVLYDVLKRYIEPSSMGRMSERWGRRSLREIRGILAQAGQHQGDRSSFRDVLANVACPRGLGKRHQDVEDSPVMSMAKHRNYAGIRDTASLSLVGSKERDLLGGLSIKGAELAFVRRAGDRRLCFTLVVSSTIDLCRGSRFRWMNRYHLEKKWRKRFR